jgi:hypothetical protein
MVVTNAPICSGASSPTTMRTPARARATGICTSSTHGPIGDSCSASTSRSSSRFAVALAARSSSRRGGGGPAPPRGRLRSSIKPPCPRPQLVQVVEGLLHTRRRWPPYPPCTCEATGRMEARRMRIWGGERIRRKGGVSPSYFFCGRCYRALGGEILLTAPYNPHMGCDAADSLCTF